MSRNLPGHPTRNIEVPAGVGSPGSAAGLPGPTPPNQPIFPSWRNQAVVVRRPSSRLMGS